MAYSSAAEQIRKNVRIDKKTGCWNWQNFLDRDGYGKVGRDDKLYFSHRLSYIAFRGEIPKGMTVDHLCENRRCSNPDHLECVTHEENMRRAAARRRSEYCSHGHHLSGDNLYLYKRRRFCRECTRMYAKKSYAKRFKGKTACSFLQA